MKRLRFEIFVLLLFLACGAAAQAQVVPAEQRPASPPAAAKFDQAKKPPIDFSVFGKWPWVDNVAISNDGNYAFYTIRNQPTESDTLVLQAIHANWKIEIPGAGERNFTEDSRQVVFTKPTDTLCLVTLGTSSQECIPNVASFALSKQRVREWLAFQLKTPDRNLVLRNLRTGNQESIPAVTDYKFSNDGEALLLQTESKREAVVAHTLKWVSLADGKSETIWQGTQASNFVFDARGTQLAFTVEDNVNSQTEKSIWYYKAGAERAVLLANNRTAGIENDLKLDGIHYSGFSKDKDGSRLFVNLKEKDYAAPKTDFVKVDIWSYTDPKLQSQQLRELDPHNRDGGPRSYAAVIDIRDHRLIRLQRENESVWSDHLDNSKHNFALIMNLKGDGDEWNWNRASLATVYLESTVDGTRKLLAESVAKRVAESYRLSPQGKYVIFYDPDAKDYFSYAVSSGVVRNITKGISKTWGAYEESDYLKPSFGMIRGLAGWLQDDAAVLIYDQRDIFQADLSGKLPPVNLTNGYGSKHNIAFKVTGYSAYSASGDPIPDHERLILTAFNRTNKYSGFCAITLGKKGDPELLAMHPYLFGSNDFDHPYGGDDPKRARDAGVYLVTRMSASESPNYFWTTDFKTFAPLSDVHPERNSNWLTSELVTWKTPDGSLSQGVLFKPENFDPKKKYPLIFYYYEKLSDEMHKFTYPEASAGTLNIPFFVSHGYLVFTPDIHYKIGHPGQSVVNTIVSAAQYLAKKPWVDPQRMGIQGHSRGGWETNYLVTHTHIFAAAMSAAGMSDYVSLYDGIRDLRTGASRQTAFELRQQRIGATLWERPDLYIENSPVFRADRVTTPLLMMSNKEDDDIPFQQSLEFFVALRRLGKKVWMLQYDGQGHGIRDNKAANDFTLRMMQFFDHYLKGAPPPKWMTEGVPARLKGIETGLELDTSGKEPGPGLLRAAAKAASLHPAPSN